MAYPEITAATDLVHNPDDPRHFMAFAPAGQRLRVYFEVLLLADSRDVLRVSEVGRSFYAPTYYFPRADVSGRYREREERTTCPLKGEAMYYDLLDSRGDVLVEKACWSYEATVPEARPLAGRFAFYPDALIFKFNP